MIKKEITMKGVAQMKTELNSTVKTNINPCLKCGCKNVEIHKSGYNAFIMCNSCGNTRGGFSTNEILIGIWNKENVKHERMIKMIWLLKPKYNDLYCCRNEVDANELMNNEGGCFVKFDHEPTEEERVKAWEDYYNSSTL